MTRSPFKYHLDFTYGYIKHNSGDFVNSSRNKVLRIRNLFDPLDPGSGIGFFRIPDHKPIFLRA
jgi:hypothetical protein